MRTIAFVSIFDRNIDLLPHWLKYYKYLGVEELHIFAPVFSDLNLADIVRTKSIDYPVSVHEFKYDGLHNVPLQLELDDKMMLFAKVEPNDCCLWTDLDEFQEYPMPLNEIIEEFNSKNISYVHGKFIDRFKEDGKLKDIIPDVDLGLQFPIGCLFTKYIGRTQCNKVMLTRGQIKFSRGRHEVIDQNLLSMNGNKFLVHHFKWTKNIENKLIERKNKPHQREYILDICNKFLDYIKDGKVDLKGMEPRYCGALHKMPVTFI